MPARIASGFTLVELIISLSLSAMLVGGMFYAFGVELGLWKRIVAASEKGQVINMVINRIVRDTRSAREASALSNINTLFLKIGSDSLEYSLTNNKVRKKINNSSSYLTTEGEIKKLSFSYPKDKLVEISIEGFTARAFLRN